MTGRSRSFGDEMHCHECIQRQEGERQSIPCEPFPPERGLRLLVESARRAGIAKRMATPDACGCRCTLCSLALEASGAYRRAERAVVLWAKAVREGAR